MILQYERQDNLSEQDYGNDLITPCKVYDGIKIGSAFCLHLCMNRISKNEEKKEVYCKNDFSIPQYKKLSEIEIKERIQSCKGFDKDDFRYEARQKDLLYYEKMLKENYT